MALSRTLAFRLIGGRGRTVFTPEQMRNQGAVDRVALGEVTAKDDAKYDSMTEDERQNYYLTPSLFTRMKRTFGRQ